MSKTHEPDPMLPRQRDYLGFENHRNTRNAQLYTDIINVAFGKVDVIIGHHLTFEQHGNIKTENEVPSADTLLFDFNVARRLFGPKALEVVQTIAAMEPESRDKFYASVFYEMYPHLKRAA